MVRHGFAVLSYTKPGNFLKSFRQTVFFTTCNFCFRIVVYWFVDAVLRLNDAGSSYFLTNSYKELSDLELARRSAELQDELAFAEIVRRYSPRVFSFASRFFRQRGLVEEAAQEVFLKAYLQLKNFEGRGSLEGWLTRITTTTCLNLLRNARHKRELTVSDLNETEVNWLEIQAVSTAEQKQSSDLDKTVAADLVNRVMDTLPADDRLVLMLTEVDGSSIKEVAEATGWSESKVKVQAFRARRRMREALEKLLGKTTKKS